MIGCLRTRVRKQPIIGLYFESGPVLKFYNLEACFSYFQLTTSWLLYESATYGPRHVISNNVAFRQVQAKTSLCSLPLSLKNLNDVQSVV